MRKLHLVGLTTGRDGLIFTARKGSKSGGFIVPLDDKVLAAVAEARKDGNSEPSAVEAVPAEVEPIGRRLRSQSALTPREMQARLRAGRSIEDVAAEAGVDNEWVARFAVPILAEQAQVVELARSLVYAKPRLGESSQPLGASVVQNLSERGVFIPDDVASAGWSAFQLHDSVWMVRFRYRSRGKDHEARWEVDVPAGRLQARNRYASDLGYVDANRRSRVVTEPDDEPDQEAVAGTPPRRSARRATRAEPKPRAAATAKRPRPTRPRPPVTARTRRSPADGARPAPKAARPSPKATKATTAAKATKTTKATPRATKAAKATKAPTAVKGATPARRAATKVAPAPAKSRAKAAPAKSTTRRRPTKAAPASDGGPTAGSGGARMAMAQVSTARMAASMATADRAPWAAAVPPRPGARPAARGNDERANGRRTSSRPAGYDLDRGDRNDEPTGPRTFQPRPLPADGGRSPRARVRRVTVQTPPAATRDPQQVSLPAPRRQPPRQEPLPVERQKRRRLRSR